MASTTFGVATVGADTASSDSDAGEYGIVQGDECITIESIGDGHQTVEEFYDYRNPETEPSAYSYSSHGTTHLQEDDTSLIFLHEGSDGLSLVVVHDQYDGDSAGGAATMVVNDLPEDGEWVVEDDDYDGADDEFDHRETSSRMTWVWADNRTDGAAFNGGLDDEFQITIDPAFNDAADFQLYDGEITDWQALSANETGYERTSLDMEQSIEIRSGGCTSYAITELSATDTVASGTSTDIEATVENDGWHATTFEIPVTVDGDIVAEEEVTLEPGETTTVSTSITLDEAGTSSVEVAEEAAEVTVEDDGNDDQMAGFGVTAVALAALFVALVAHYRS